MEPVRKHDVVYVLENGLEQGWVEESYPEAEVAVVRFDSGREIETCWQNLEVL